MNGRASYCQGIAWVIAPVLLPDCFRIASGLRGSNRTAIHGETMQARLPAKKATALGSERKDFSVCGFEDEPSNHEIQ
ncbi:hypothetical protein [Paraburkholderia tropica]|uniref:hypothetical protein n=1 Tax=Paraburkholderia tropica TaxID=92647 RepID=UPI001CC70A67|nr:hypothetical protein [Paraburkholderia tropica]